MATSFLQAKGVASNRMRVRARTRRVCASAGCSYLCSAHAWLSLCSTRLYLALPLLHLALPLLYLALYLCSTWLSTSALPLLSLALVSRSQTLALATRDYSGSTCSLPLLYLAPPDSSSALPGSTSSTWLYLCSTWLYLCSTWLYLCSTWLYLYSTWLYLWALPLQRLMHEPGGACRSRAR